MIDARVRATTASLERAIVRLASEQPVSTLTVLQITEAAGINRATFYRHAQSPTALLDDVLRRDLDAIRADDRDRRERHRVDTTVDVFTHSLGLVADHVERFLPIYQRAFSAPGDAGAALALTEHLTGSCLAILAGFGSEDTPQVNPEITARFLGYGLAGAISAWVSPNSECTRDDFLHASDQLFPEWWRS